MLTLRSIFLYLDRTHVAAAAGARSLFDMGLQLFCSHLALHPEVLACISMLPCRACYAILPVQMLSWWQGSCILLL